MAWDPYYEQDEREDREHAFEITCASCGNLYSNLNGACPNCGDASGSYDGRAAARWNAHLKHTGR